ncbi:MAG: M20 aminoacylase family protein [Sphingomonas sp.]
MTTELSTINLDAHIALRRDIHAHPELAFDEHRTADLIAARLASMGIEIHRGVGGTGVVGVLKRGTSKRMIGLRADMDALPLTEANRFAHASTVAGRMHACGHDGHVAMLVAAAQVLAENAMLDGTVVFIFQPGEESGRGARVMIADGLFDRWPVETVFAAHNWPGLGVGQFAVAPGPMMAACNTFTLTIEGKGGHAALPHLTVDPVLAGAALVQALQAIVARATPADEAAVLSIGMFEAGSSPHIIPDRATLRGTVRTFSAARTDAIETQMRTIAEGVAMAHGCSVTLDFERNCAATLNSAAETALVAEALSKRFGDVAVERATPAMTAEDFAFMLEARPGAYFWIGNGDGDARAPGHAVGPCALHNPSYDFDDRLIAIGAAAWVAITEHFFESQPSTA